MSASSQNRRQTRRLAMQVLYQIDATGETDAEAIFAGLDEDHDPVAVRAEAVALALAAWTGRDALDAKVGKLAADWPTHRQPPVDRAILRLAVHEMVTGRTPPRVAINEAVELAKQFSNENAPAFINGVLDKLHRSLDLPPETKTSSTEESKPADPVAWLDDATRDE
ncbi:MAG: transcription antitermination factor NusB [Planctomycetota bacterium]